MAAPSGMQLYFSLCGVEVWNQARLRDYMANGVSPAGARMKQGGCGTLADLIPCAEHQPGAEGYTLPDVDGAPWYDPSAPESKNFAGLMVTDVTMSGPVRRRMIQNIGHGGVLGRVRYPGRTIGVKGVLIGKTCCATEYGLRWLTQALLGNFCDCGNCDAHFLSCCPSASGEDDCLIVDGEPYVRTGELGELLPATYFVRNMHDVGLLEAPEIVKCRTVGCGACGCGTLTEVEFTLGVGIPWMHMEPEVVVEDFALGTCDPDVCSVTWVKSDKCSATVNCEDVGDCDDHDLHPRPPKPPRAWTPIIDGVCISPATQIQCLPMNEDNQREWMDSTLVIEVNAGSEELRGLAIRFFKNPMLLDCCDGPTFEDPCLACASLYVRYIPAGGVITIDGPRRRVTMTCAGIVERDASHQVFTADGKAFDWVDLGCAPHCVQIERDCFNTAADATVNIYQVIREL